MFDYAGLHVFHQITILYKIFKTDLDIKMGFFSYEFACLFKIRFAENDFQQKSHSNDCLPCELKIQKLKNPYENSNNYCTQEISNRHHIQMDFLLYDLACRYFVKSPS